MKHRILSTIFIVVTIFMMVTMSASADATAKSLSTNFTLVNLGAEDANVTVDYIKPDGTPWTGSAYTSQTIAKNGGQWIVRQYFDTNLTAGKGSVVISSSQQLGSLVQIINRNTSVTPPTSGAYSGFTGGTQKAFAPQVAKGASSATGIANSQIMVQNTGAAPATVTFRFFQGSATPKATRTSPSPVAVGATYYYDLSNDSALTTGWYSVEIDAGTGGSIAAVVNTFFGADSLMTSNAFPSDRTDSKWFIPLLYSKLTNTLNTSLVIQNRDTTQIDANDIVLNCASGGPTGFKYTSAVPVNGAASFNTYTEGRFPANWQGGCNVSSASGKKLAVLIMYRYINGADQAAYEGVPASSTDKTVFVPLIAKRLANYFCTAATIQNLSNLPATATITYTPSNGGTPIVRNNVSIPAGGSIVRNFRLATTEAPDIPDGWQGTMKVVANQPIAAYVANTYLTVNGDQFMAYLGLTQP